MEREEFREQNSPEPTQDSTLSVTDITGSSLAAAMHSGLGIASPFTREIFLANQAIVGMRYQGGSDELVGELEPGSRISFMREPDNRFDPKAIMALDEQGRKLGYIPRNDNAILSSLMDAGKYLYGIVSEKPEGRNYTGGRTPTVMYVDLYLREFASPGDMTQIPRQGYRGSYAVMDLELDEDSKICSVHVIKVINGEERGFFTGNCRDTCTDTPIYADQEALIRDLRSFIGYLPVVAYGISGKPQEILEEAWGVCTGKPFSNLVIDIRQMAKNHLYGLKDYSLECVTDRLGVEADCSDPAEKRCRQVWQIYCRFDRSELKKGK